jgi:hypothetical protein
MEYACLANLSASEWEAQSACTSDAQIDAFRAAVPSLLLWSLRVPHRVRRVLYYGTYGGWRQY